MAKKIINRRCPRCKKIREFEIRKRKNNLKVICQACGLKMFVKADEEINEDLSFYFPYKFKKSEEGGK